MKVEEEYAIPTYLAYKRIKPQYPNTILLIKDSQGNYTAYHQDAIDLCSILGWKKPNPGHVDSVAFNGDQVYKHLAKIAAAGRQATLSSLISPAEQKHANEVLETLYELLTHGKKEKSKQESKVEYDYHEGRFEPGVNLEEYGLKKTTIAEREHLPAQEDGKMIHGEGQPASFFIKGTKIIDIYNGHVYTIGETIEKKGHNHVVNLISNDGSIYEEGIDSGGKGRYIYIELPVAGEQVPLTRVAAPNISDWISISGVSADDVTRLLNSDLVTEEDGIITYADPETGEELRFAYYKNGYNLLAYGEHSQSGNIGSTMPVAKTERVLKKAIKFLGVEKKQDDAETTGNKALTESDALNIAIALKRGDFINVDGKVQKVEFIRLKSYATDAKDKFLVKFEGDEKPVGIIGLLMSGVAKLPELAKVEVSTGIPGEIEKYLGYENFKPNERDFVNELFNTLKEIIDNDNRALTEKKIVKRAEELGIADRTIIKELTEMTLVMFARYIIATYPREQIFEEMERLYKKQPSINTRSSNSIMLQQYSTPAPIAYLCGLFCGLSTSKASFEPSAGNGMLTIAGKPDSFIVNEIDVFRNRTLRLFGYKAILNRDGSTPFPADYRNRFDAVITNPPFEKLGYEEIISGFKILRLEHLMAIYALQTMFDTGRAAIIIGGNNKWNSKGQLEPYATDAVFFTYLYKHYNVLDVINIGGYLYSRQGAVGDIRIILIAGRKSEPQGRPFYYDEVKDIANPENRNSQTMIVDFKTMEKRILDNLK